MNTDTETVARRAYEIWQREGCPSGRAEEHWFRAMSELAAAGDGVSSTNNLKIRTPRRSAAKAGGRQLQVSGQTVGA